MVPNNLRVCYAGGIWLNCLWRNVCLHMCVRVWVAASVLSVNATSAPLPPPLSLSHLCHLIFIPIKTLFHISFLSLSCLLPLLFPLFVFLCASFSRRFPPLDLVRFDFFSPAYKTLTVTLHGAPPPRLASPVFSATLLADFPHCFKFVASTFNFAKD